MTRSSETIRALNDDLRRQLSTKRELAFLTPGIAALGPEAVERIVTTLTTYDDFCQENDPYSEHDFGSFEADGKLIFFKIDYYDTTLTFHSPDPSNPAVTRRVLTIMLADEY
jgi:hypothetical protein